MDGRTKYGDTVLHPWVVVSPDGVNWLGHAVDEDGAWQIALGFPSENEVQMVKAGGWYAAKATVSWEKPEAD